MQDHLIEITQSKITIFNIGNGVRTNKNGYLCGVKEDTQSPSGTEVPVASTWQIMETDEFMPCAIRGQEYGHEV